MPSLVLLTDDAAHDLHYIAAAKAPARGPSSRDAISGPPGDIGTMTPGACGPCWNDVLQAQTPH